VVLSNSTLPVTGSLNAVPLTWLVNTARSCQRPAIGWSTVRLALVVGVRVDEVAHVFSVALTSAESICLSGLTR